MPDSKLAEKLGFSIGVPPGAHPEAFDVIYNNGRESDWATPAEIALWNLCLELSERLERFQDLRKAADEASFFLGTVWTAQSLNTPNEKTTHHVWTNLQKALTDLSEAERLAEKEKKA